MGSTRTSICWSDENRIAAANTLAGSRTFFVEDDPYGELRFTGTAKTSFKKLLPDQTILLGRKAKDAAELLDGLINTPDSSIYYHTHHFLQQHHYLSPEPPNDYAYWATEVLNDSRLGEQLWSIDIVQYSTMDEIRRAFLEVLQSRLADGQKLREAPPGGEFHFMASRTFVLTTKHIAHTLDEFRAILAGISVNSIYYHMFDARLRLQQSGTNDFSRWFAALGKQELANQVSRLDRLVVKHHLHRHVDVALVVDRTRKGGQAHQRKTDDREQDHGSEERRQQVVAIPQAPAARTRRFKNNRLCRRGHRVRMSVHHLCSASHSRIPSSIAGW